MADYGQVCFTNADSATHNGTTVDGGTGDNINMLDSSNHVVSEGILLGPTTRWNPYSTGIEGVYLCSASTPPGGGVHGMCGEGAAR